MAVSATPNVPFKDYVRTSSQVKSATPDLIIEDQMTTPIELMEQLIFEKIGGQELLLLSRHDNLNGQKVAYQPISNLTELSIKYSPETLIFASESFKDYFKNFTILLESAVPELIKYDVDGAIIFNDSAPNAYTSNITGGITLEFSDIKNGQQVEVQIMSNTKLFDDTIY
jgi:hypothetical protein